VEVEVALREYEGGARIAAVVEEIVVLATNRGGADAAGYAGKSNERYMATRV